MPTFRDLAKRTLDSTYERLGEPATNCPLVGGVPQTGQPVTVMPTTRDIEVQKPYRNTKIGVAVAAVDNKASSTIGTVRINGSF